MKLLETELLKQTYLLTQQLGSQFPTIFADELFAARMRKMRPQGASYSLYPPSIWPLFDACGSVRETGLGNPQPQPTSPTDPKAKWKERGDTYEQLQAKLKAAYEEIQLHKGMK